jgi:hypothetical protein
MPDQTAAYSARVTEALRLEDGDEAVRRAKSVVAEELSSLDRRVSLVQTAYFNHSWVPDLVVNWPHLGANTERYVYLRYSLNRRHVAEDVSRLSRSSPIFVELGSDEAGVPASTNDDLPIESVEEAAISTNTLLTDTAALQIVSQSPDDAPVVSLLATALLRGGRGLVDTDAASSATADVREGFDGAQALDATRTAKAVATAEKFLQVNESDRLTSFLQAMWLGSGGMSSEFPGAARVLDLGAEGLQFLMDHDEIEDAGFWTAVGRSVALPDVTALRVEGFSENLQHLVRASLQNLAAKTCKVLDDQPRLDTTLPDYYWVIERRLLGLRSPDATTYVARKLDEMQVGSSTAGDGVPLPTLLERAERHGLEVSDLELTRGDKALVYRSDSSSDIIHDPELDQISETFGADSRVTRATTRMPAEVDLLVDFRESSTRGRTSAQFPVASLARRTLMLLRNLDDDEMTKLDEIIPGGERMPEAGGQLGLDLEDEPE